MSKKSLRRARQEAAASARARGLRRQHQLGARRRNQESRGRAHRSTPRARELGFSTSIGIIHDGSGRLKPLGAGRAQGLRRGVGRRSAGRWQVVQESLLGDHAFPGQPGGRQAERMAMPRRRALSVRLRERPGALLLAAARLPGRAARDLHASTTSGASSSTPKSCAPYCTIGCVHRVSTMDFWRVSLRRSVVYEQHGPGEGIAPQARAMGASASPPSSRLVFFAAFRPVSVNSQSCSNTA